MKQPNSHWFHQGKVARHAGQPCECPPDGRMTPQSRQEWYQGWNCQDSLMRPAAEAEEIEDTQTFLRGLKESLAAALP